MGLFRWLFGGGGRPKVKREDRWFLDPTAPAEAHLLLEEPFRVPPRRGMYAWYFCLDDLPAPDLEYWGVNDFALLYVGITGTKDKSDSEATLRDRIIGQHLRGNAYGSSLRFSLGILLMRKLQLELEPYGSSGFHWPKEDLIADWLAGNALVAWVEDAKPWKREESAIERYGRWLPLNYEHNKSNDFAAKIHKMKTELRKIVHRDR